MDWVLHDRVARGSGLRSSAIVVMTDGVDNAIPGVAGPGSKMPFDGLLERIRSSESIVFPIYLDTEAENVKKYHTARGLRAGTRSACADRKHLRHTHVQSRAFERSQRGVCA